MSEINELLEQIASAYYGEQMRKAIHDAIELCYTDGQGNSVDLTARNYASGVNDRLSVLISNLNIRSSTSTSMTYDASWSAGENNTPTVIKIGNIVQLTGRVTAKEKIQMTDHGHYKNLFRLPNAGTDSDYRSDYSPMIQVYTAQRFGAFEYSIRVTTDGWVSINRIGPNKTFTITKGDTFAFNIVYFVAEGNASGGNTEIEDARYLEPGRSFNTVGDAIRYVYENSSAGTNAEVIDARTLDGVEYDTLSDVLAFINNAVKTNASNISTANGKITTATNKANTNASNITALTTRVTAAESSISNLTPRMASAESSVASLGTRMTTAENSLSSVKTEVQNARTVNGTAYGSLKAALQGIDNKISNIATASSSEIDNLFAS